MQNRMANQRKFNAIDEYVDGMTHENSTWLSFFFNIKKIPYDNAMQRTYNNDTGVDWLKNMIDSNEIIGKRYGK